MNKLIFILYFIAFSTYAHAYVDPGTGSVIISAIVGFFAGIGFFIKKYYYKIKKLFSKKEKHDD